MELDGATAIVTGGAGAIGTEIARALGAHGAKVARWDQDAADDVVDCDVSDADQVLRAFVETERRMGVPALLVNAASVSGGRSMLAAEAIGAGEEGWRSVLSPPEAWRAVFAVNVMGVVHTTRLFAERAARVTTGEPPPRHVVNISSIAADRIFDPEITAYSASKAAVDTLTRVSAVDLGPLGIRVNSLSPGVMGHRLKHTGVDAEVVAKATPTDLGDRASRMTPVEQRPGRAHDLAEAVCAVASMDFVTGQVIPVDGGFSLFRGARG